MDDALEQIIATLPGVPARDYDGLSVTQDCLDRLVKSHLANARPSDAPITTTFAGITVVANPHIPDGYAVMTRGGEPVGVINFKGRYRAHAPRASAARTANGCRASSIRNATPTRRTNGNKVAR